jgi:phosphatidate cytidylyltransferase
MTDSASAPPTHEAKRKSVFQRIVTGTGFMLFCIVLTFMPQVHGLPFVLAVAVLSIIGAQEFYSAVRRQGAEPSEVLGFIACILFQLAAWRQDGAYLDPYLPAFMTLLVLVTMFVELVKPKNKPILNIGATLLGAIYCGWLFSFLIVIHGSHLIAHPPIQGTTTGEWLAIFVIIVTSFNDIGGLIGGNLAGRHKIAPLISPKKTVEGAIGGLILAAAVASLLGAWIKIPLIVAAPMGVVLGITGLAGDLCESALKRYLGVKDFVVILPGHGGLLDRIDSILFTAPVAYYFLLIATRFLH